MEYLTTISLQHDLTRVSEQEERKSYVRVKTSPTDFSLAVLVAGNKGTDKVKVSCHESSVRALVSLTLRRGEAMQPGNLVLQHLGDVDWWALVIVFGVGQQTAG